MTFSKSFAFKKLVNKKRKIDNKGAKNNRKLDFYKYSKKLKNLKFGENDQKVAKIGQIVAENLTLSTDYMTVLWLDQLQKWALLRSSCQKRTDFTFFGISYGLFFQ